MPDAPTFSADQRSYLSGFLRGLDEVRRRSGLPLVGDVLPLAEPAGGAVQLGVDRPEAVHLRAQDRFVAEGRKLCAEEEAKRAENPLDVWDRMVEHAAAGRFPGGIDVFRWKFHGLFYVAPAESAFMCRLRLPGGILSAHRLRAIAEIAERHAAGFADVTTRANLQLRGIAAERGVEVLTALHDLGIVPRGAGADNVRNVTGSPTAGIDPHELFDTRPLTRALHHHILQHRELYGLPRKFNVAFDGGGDVGVLEDTNDLGFSAVSTATAPIAGRRASSTCSIASGPRRCWPGRRSCCRARWCVSRARPASPVGPGRSSGTSASTRRSSPVSPSSGWCCRWGACAPIR